MRGLGRRVVTCLLACAVTALSGLRPAFALAYVDPMLVKASKCSVRKHEKIMRSLVVSLPGSAEQEKAWRVAAPPLADCLGESAADWSVGQQGLFLGEAAYQLLRSTGSTFRSHWVGEAPSPDALGQKAAWLTIGYAPRPAFAACVANVYSNEVGEWLSANPGSEAEQTRFRSLIDGASVCLDAGGQLRASAGELRADIARAMYRHIFMRSIALPPAALEGSK